jgi:hypothetical protein
LHQPWYSIQKIREYRKNLIIKIYKCVICKQHDKKGEKGVAENKKQKERIE